MEKKVFKFNADNKNVNVATHFCLGTISNRFSATESSEVSWKWNMCNFSVELNFIDKSGILNIHNYLMTKNNIKYVLPYKPVLVALLSFSISLATKFVPLNDEPCMNHY